MAPSGHRRALLKPRDYSGEAAIQQLLQGLCQVQGTQWCDIYSQVTQFSWVKQEAKIRWALRFFSGVTFQCPTESLLVPNPMHFPLQLLDDNFLQKCLWWFPTVCGEQHLAPKHLRPLTFWAQINITLYLLQSWTPVLQAWEQLAIAEPVMCSLPCAYIMSPAENVLLTLPLAEISSSKVSGLNTSTPPPPHQPPWPAAQVDSDKITFSFGLYHQPIKIRILVSASPTRLWVSEGQGWCNVYLNSTKTWDSTRHIEDTQ